MYNPCTTLATNCATPTTRLPHRPQPNNGRWFWSCGKFSMTGGGAQCDFMKFEDQVVEPPGMSASSGGGGAERRWGAHRR